MTAAALLGGVLVAIGAVWLLRSAVRENHVDRIRSETALLAEWVLREHDDDLQVFAEEAAGRLGGDVEPTATAAVLVAMLAHVAGHQYGIEAYGTSTTAIRTSMARLLYAGLTGDKPPA